MENLATEVQEDLIEVNRKRKRMWLWTGKITQNIKDK